MINKVKRNTKIAWWLVNHINYTFANSESIRKLLVHILDILVDDELVLLNLLEANNSLPQELEYDLNFFRNLREEITSALDMYTESKLFFALKRKLRKYRSRNIKISKLYKNSKTFKSVVKRIYANSLKKELIHMDEYIELTNHRYYKTKYNYIVQILDDMEENYYV